MLIDKDMYANEGNLKLATTDIRQWEGFIFVPMILLTVKITFIKIGHLKQQ